LIEVFLFDTEYYESQLPVLWKKNLNLISVNLSCCDPPSEWLLASKLVWRLLKTKMVEGISSKKQVQEIKSPSMCVGNILLTVAMFNFCF